ncbi:MAG TPA: peptidyl-dipeptidase Dcp [Longimicrobiaceae bacterium]|jgi:peptidyl-dipeptidase Dcp|nr:peptidyl-dipeptidase Dcp [Longimicrobiaceae bacterium]
MSRSRSLLIAAGLAVTGCAHAGPRAENAETPPPAEPAPVAAAPAPAPAPGLDPANPFFAASTLPYQAPPFDRIHDADFQPALEEGMRQHLAEVEGIASQAAEPTFDNTLVALERSGRLLTRVSKVFYALTQANTNDAIQKVEAEEAPKLAGHFDAIYLNDALFRRVKSLYDRRAALGLDAEQNRLVERYYRDFVRAGAQLSEADKTRLKALNQEESGLTTEFSNKLLAATKAGAVVVDDSTQLRGLAAPEIAAAEDAANQRGMPGKWVLPLQNTTQQPALASLRNRALRQRLFEASTRRADKGDSTDTRAIVRRLAQLRAERARLLGYSSYAAFRLDDQMAKTPETAIRLMTDLAPAATAKARTEQADMQPLLSRDVPGARLAAWDRQYYSEQVRKARYDLDESQIKPYFELDRVLNDGVFFAANKLYGLTFKERKDIPVYHPDVRVFEVFDADGSSLALFYCDYYKRDNKGGGAWMDNFVDQSGLFGTKPVVFNVANFQKPAPGQPALLSYDDVTTMFHEFGHALHGMFSRVQYPTLSGTAVPRDFVEFPSQFNEHWALEPSVFANYAKHYRTGAPMPRALVQKIKAAHTFNQGYATTEYLEAALLDMAWHSLPADAPQQDVAAFESQALARFNVSLPEVPPRYRTPYFAHVWGGGYAAGYYAYLWSEVLDHDAYYWFVEHGGATRANGQRFREMVLSRGGTQDAATLYRNFRGRDPSVEPLVQERGLKDPAGGRGH